MISPIRFNRIITARLCSNYTLALYQILWSSVIGSGLRTLPIICIVSSLWMAMDAVAAHEHTTDIRYPEHKAGHPLYSLQACEPNSAHQDLTGVTTP